MRAQIQTAVGMILTLTIIAATLALGTWGFLALTNSTSDVAYTRITNALEDASSTHRSFGSRAVVSISPPEPFCVFNLSAPADCVRDYSGYEQCEDQFGYWDVAGPNDGNVQFESGRTERVDNLYPENGKYACFTRGSRVAFIKGQGSHITASPMREIDRFVLQDGGGGAPAIEAALYTTQPNQAATPELLYIFNESVASTGPYGVDFASNPRSLGSSYELQTIDVGFGPYAVVTSIVTTPLNVLADAGIEVPQQP